MEDIDGVMMGKAAAAWAVRKQKGHRMHQVHLEAVLGSRL